MGCKIVNYTAAHNHLFVHENTKTHQNVLKAYLRLNIQIKDTITANVPEINNNEICSIDYSMTTTNGNVSETESSCIQKSISEKRTIAQH